MKIDRVILTSNNNENYYHFWNIVSKIYKINFNITPTLIWFGNEEEIETLGLSKEYGDIICQKPHEEYQVPWQTTWGLFYFTKFFKDEVCLTIGIDEIPLSKMFINDLIEEIDDDLYVTLIDDAYPTHWTIDDGVSPSAYHIAKGKTFDEIYNFEEDFFLEVEKVYQSKDSFWSSGEDKWGIDESYSSKKMRNFKNRDLIKSIGHFGLLKDRRIDCNRDQEPKYDVDLMQNGHYSEIHLCRPYTKHTDYIDKLINLIPKY
jgi:hypothetical protein